MVKDYLSILSELTINKKKYKYYDLKKLSKSYPSILNLPFSIRILLENVIRNYDNFSITKEHINIILDWKNTQGKKHSRKNTLKEKHTESEEITHLHNEGVAKVPDI